MNKDTEYLLKYITNDTYHTIITRNNSTLIDELIDNRREVDLNLRYLIQLGVKNIDHIVLERLDDLLLPHHSFMQKIDQYEQSLGKDDLINMLENS